MQKPSQGSKITSLDAGRFVAALLVVLHHATLIPMEPRFLGYAPMGNYFFPGHMGVEFFFVLSGFIIMYAHQADLGRPSRYGHYLWRRISRIYFPYWIVLAFLIPAYLFTGMGTAEKRDLGYLLASIFLVPQPSQPVLGVAWTLTHEMMFYLIFGLFILNRRLMAPLIGLWLALILMNQYVWQLPYPGAFFLSLYNILFMIGLGCAVYLKERAVPAPWLVLAAGAAIVAFAWVADLREWLGWDQERYVQGAASALILMALVELERTDRIAVPRWLVMLGAASYALYLVHAVVQSFVLNFVFRTGLGDRLPEAALFAGLVLLPLAVGLAFHYAAERPVIRFFRGGLFRKGRVLNPVMAQAAVQDRSALS